MAVLLLLPVALKAQDIVEISNGNHNQFNNALPTYTAANYSLSEQIYTAAEIGRAGTIYSITFKGSWYSATRNVDIYMVHTNKTSFQNSKDWEPVTTADRVYSGIFAFPGGELTIDLQVPFQYNGIDNLVLVVDDNTGSPASNTGNYFGPMINIESFFSYSYPQVLQIYGNDVDYDPTSRIYSLSLTGDLDYYKNQVWLGFTSTCPPPSNPTDSIISQTSAMLSWTESGSATQWQVCVNGDETNPITVTTNSYTLNGLTPGTDYPVKVRSICGANDTSQWCNEVIVNTVPSYPDLVEIGFCTGTSHGLLPSSSDDNYSLSEQIYTAAEIGRPGGNISGISFFNNGDTKTRTLDIYLAHTTKSSFLSYDDWVSVTASDWVFSDNVEMKAGEWTSIEFDVPFQYNGTDNLLLVVDDNTDSWSSGMDCFTFPTTESQALSLMGWVNFDPSSPNGYGGSLWNIKNCIQLNFGTVCPKPKNLTASTNHNEVTLTWTSSATNFNVEYKKTTDTIWQQTSTSTNTITLSGLGNANYEARVKAVCDPGVSESVWDTVTFSILDIQSNANWYAYVQGIMDHPEWERKFISFSIPNLNTADTASETLYDYPVALTYANGYVWGCFYDYNSSYINLYRAQLHNDTKTIGNFATVKENFENDYIPSMAYNPVDGKIYYLRGDYKLFGFDPSNPEVVTEIGNYTQDFEKITINGSGEAFCFDSYTEDLYRISLTDATTTLVGNTPEILNIAFDQATNELFCTKYANTGEMLYWMDTATAQTMEIGFIGDDTTAMFHAMFMVGSTANICYAPENLTISSIGMHGATLQWDADSNASSWVVEYATVPDFSGATSVNVSTNSCQLSGLNSETLYYVRVKVVCSSNSESNWTKGSFHTEICPTADQCAITYKLGDTYGDGWNGCAINVVDVATDIVIGTLTMTTNDGDTLLGTLPVCDGRDIRFEWVKGYYAEETSYTIFSALGDTLFSGSDTLIAPVTYTVNCPANPNIVKIGTCNGGSDYLPSHSSSNYSFSQQIYTASEINRTGTISGISFYNAGTTQSRNFDMYIVHTNKSAFDHNLDWISTTPADLVFSGPIELTAGAWTEIALDVPFAYNGTDNLLLVMNDKTGNSATGMSCYTFQTSAIEAIYGYRDGSSFDPMFPHSILGDYNHEKNCVRLNFGTNCTKPANLTVSENGMNQAKIVWDNSNNANTWIVEYSSAADFSGSTTTTVTTNSYLLTGLTPETEYHVRVKADCGADGESYWNVISFFTNSCPIENQCEITYKLGDSYGNGWTGNAINVVDVTSNIVLDTWTIQYGDSASGSLFVCDGREIRFEWVSGYDPNEISYRVYDANGLQILNGVGAFLTPVTYMVNCASSPCPTPGNIAVSNFSGGTVTVSWTENGSATSWQICLDGNEANPISVNTNPYTLSGLDSTVFHNVKVRANCGSDYSFWSTPASFAQVQSTGNWYAHVQSCPNNTDLRNKFVSFSAQDPANASAASNVIPNVLAATYANGEVWFFDDDNTNLYKAPLDNNTKTMGAYETVATNFDGNNNIASMSYNPVDGRIYYILYTPSQTVKLKSFAPSSINDVTEIGTFNNYAFSIAIDNNGNAYCTDVMTGNLCQVNLTNATTTPVGDLGFSSTMPVIAFDMNTGELLMGQLESSGDNGIYLVNPATAEKQLIGYIGGGTGATISSLFMVSGSTPVVTCPAPTNLTASNITDENATLTWTENGSATEWQVCIDGDETNPVLVPENPYLLGGLEPGTNYTVKIRANCGANGYSDWSNEVSFTTVDVPPYFFIDGADSICPNQTTTLYVNTNMGTNYLWNTGETSQSITVPVGTYSVSVSKNGNVVAYGSFEVKGKQSYNITVSEAVCASQLPYVWNGDPYNASGSYSKTFTAANGCDSTVTLVLTVNNPAHTAYTVTAYDTYTWANGDGQTYTTSGDYQYSHTDNNGCTQVDTLHLTVFHSSSNEFAVTACESYEWDGIVYTASGDYPRQYQDIHGADSLVTLHLTINQPQHQAYTVTAYDTYTWANGNGQTYTTSGNYQYSHLDGNGCTQVDTLHLTVFHSSSNEFAVTACESYEWDGIVYTASGDYPRQYQDIHGADSTVTLHLTINQPQHQAYTVTAYDTYTWANGNGLTYTTSGDYQYSHLDNNGCTQIDTLHLTVFHSSSNEFAVTACESYEWDGVVYTASGDYPRQYQDIHGADSTVTLHLHNAVTETACESFTWTNGDGQTYTTSGTYTHDYTNADGCASVDTLHLTIYHGTHNAVTETACESFTWTNGDGQTYTTSGTYTHDYTNADGCASVDTLHLTIYHGTHNAVTETACESFTWTNGNGQTYTASGTYTHDYNNADGCASVDTLHLTIYHGTHNAVTETACESFTWTNGDGQTYTTSGTYTHDYTNADGCASVDTLHLTINHGTHNAVTETACESFTWTNGNGQTYTTSGTYTHDYTNADGCASVDTLHLTIYHGTHNAVTEIACESFTWTNGNGQTYTTSGTYTHDYTNADGCASVDTLHLTIYPTYTFTDIRSVCPSELPYTWNGVTFNAAGAQSVTLQTINGCDSVVTMILTVNQTHVTTDSRTICQSELPYTWNGVTFNAASVKTAILQDANGCDSTVIMTLTVNPTYNISETQSVCQSELPYTWNGIVFNAAGSQVLNLQTVNGCDSVVTMTLTVNPTYAVSDTRSVCPSELPYTWNGVTFNAAGAQSVTLQAANGCDSVVTMILTVNQTHVTNDSRTICQSELPYTWNEVVFSAAGVQTTTLQDMNGCDSTVIMTLVVNPTVNTEFTVETEDSCYTWNSETYCVSGDYVQTLTADNGCDSVVTLHLTLRVGIDDHHLAASMKVYPNPTTGVLNIQVTNFGAPVSEFHLYDAYGKLVDVVRTPHGTSTETTQIDLRRLANGLYFVKAISDGNVVAVRKVVKE